MAAAVNDTDMIRQGLLALGLSFEQIEAVVKMKPTPGHSNIYVSLKQILYNRIYNTQNYSTINKIGKNYL